PKAKNSETTNRETGKNEGRLEAPCLAPARFAFLRRVVGEPAPQGVFRDDPGVDELLQVVRATGLEARARQAEAAERLPAHHGPRDPAVDIQVPDPELPPRPLDARRAAGENAARQFVFAVVGQSQRLVERARPHD